MVNRWSLIVRLLLSLCVVLNGFGAGSLAHAQHQLAAERSPVVEESLAGQPSQTEAIEPAAATQAPPCHGSDSSHAPADEATEDDSAATQHEESPDGCCGLAGCGGMCLHHPTGPITSWTSAIVLAQTTEAAPLRTLHISPQLAHLIRPPIA